MIQGRQLLDRAETLYGYQVDRSRQKKSKSGRITKKGYTLPFNRQQFIVWLSAQFGGNLGSAIRCRYCNRPIDIFSCQIDHGTSLDRGGSPGLENLSPTCKPCNQTKGTMSVEEMDYLVAFLYAMAKHFSNSEAADSITQRLESYSAMKANTNKMRAQNAANKAPGAGRAQWKRKAARPAPQVTSFDDSDF